MEYLNHIIDIFIHLDKHLFALVNDYQSWTYLILFLIIFCETGLVVTPFLPGDSLLFAAGALVATGSFDFIPLFTVLIVAAILGDMVNYHIGKYSWSIFHQTIFLQQQYLTVISVKIYLEAKALKKALLYRIVSLTLPALLQENKKK